jgi:hypothetical protein
MKLSHASPQTLEIATEAISHISHRTTTTMNQKDNLTLHNLRHFYGSGAHLVILAPVPA